MDIVDRMIQHEAGELDQDETVELFQELVNTGTAWQLQGHYGRTAQALIEAGLVTEAKLGAAQHASHDLSAFEG